MDSVLENNAEHYFLHYFHTLRVSILSVQRNTETIEHLFSDHDLVFDNADEKYE